MSSKPFLSVIIPVYNEKERINNLIYVYEYLKKQKYSIELIVVDDGSTDNTKRILQKLSKTIPFTLISYEHNKGKGYAIRKGMLYASGSHKLFMDIDLSVPLETIEKFLKEIPKNKIIIASRRIKGANIIERQPIMREVMGRIFTKLSQITLQTNISDFTCGLKCFEQEVAGKIFSRAKIDRWGFDSEIIFIATKFGFQIKEVPVEWSNDSHSKVKFPKDAICSLKELFEIRLNDLLDKYS